jgi:hypothetical protein
LYPLEVEMTRVYVATVLNFFLPGAGHLVLGRRVVPGVCWLIGAVGLTGVELSLQGGPLYWPMFASVFVLNTGFAIDTFVGARAALREPAGL